MRQRWRVLRPAGFIALALALGVGSAWWFLRHGAAGAHQLQVGAWVTSSLAGSPDADLYTRARVSLGGLLALGREETIYYVARTDDQGRPLRSRCRYRVQGIAPAARWWSVTAYADDLFLFDTPDRRFSLNSDQAKLDATGRFVLGIGPDPEAGQPWLLTPGDRGVVLTLRLYHPSPALQAAPAGLVAPSIQSVGECR